MSDHPTRRLPPARPVLGEPNVAYVSDEAIWREHIHDRLRSLTTAVTLASLVAVAALGVTLWALFADPADDASADRVQRLEQRVDQLEARLTQRPAAEDLVAVRERQQSLDERLQALEDQADEPAEETQAMIEAIESTQQAIAQLEERVAELEQSAP
jgi:peptidoglycan hydrolase CwlO-like protein